MPSDARFTPKQSQKILKEKLASFFTCGNLMVFERTKERDERAGKAKKSKWF